MLRIDIHRLRFLVIEDSAPMRHIIRTLLHGFGSRDVREAEDGGTGFGIFNEYQPDIVLTAYALRIVDGLEITRMIRQSNESSNPFVPIILCANHTDKTFVTAARDAGVTEVLAKPFSAKSLYERIVYIVANPRPFIKTKTFFGPNRRRNAGLNHAGPERRKDGKADVTQVPPLLDKTKASV